MRGRIYSTLYERLVANTRVDDNGCWVWTGVKGPGGYGRVAVRVPEADHPRLRAAHRVMLEIVTGWLFPFDEGEHTCFNTSCINPDHLRIVTKTENTWTRRTFPGKKDGCWIPVLFPTPERLLDEAAERAWEGIGTVVHPANEPCPF